MPTWATVTWRTSKQLFQTLRGGAEVAFGCADDLQTHILCLDRDDHDFSTLYALAVSTEMKDQVTKPIFVVGSPRSGTTVLACCICQHPNILYQEEADWRGPFAIDAAVNHRRGSARGPRGQLSAIGVRREEFLMSFGQSINELILSHRKQFQSRRAQWDLPPFTISRSPEEPKSRWVAGAPENSFYVCGLRKLFPQALFIHLVRDVKEVVRSLLNFFPDGRNRLIANEQDAYDIWLRRVNSCLDAERAYGPSVVHRMRYSDLLHQPEAAMRSLLEFLGEPYAPQCFEPLAKRINSSNVPSNFNPSDPATDPAMVARAEELSDQLQNLRQPRETSAGAAEKLEAEFDHLVQYFHDLGRNYSEAQRLIISLQRELEHVKASAAGASVT
jgi:hypothetical protein